mmetsp:Transcript_10048/g.16595  ORF Transcript_10048/g.16595 Transcript_10048/m.16595 type:complete len:102 (-) Transcript_10048:362-667(-)
MGTVPNVVPFSRQLCGKQQSSPEIEAIVQGVGASATSFPPMLTIRMSCDEMLSRMNLSCPKRDLERWLSVVASIAVLIAAYVVIVLSGVLELFSFCRLVSR